MYAYIRERQQIDLNPNQTWDITIINIKLLFLKYKKLLF